MVAIPTILYSFNVADFGKSSSDLANNIRTEERVAIWQDDWKMQQASSQKARRFNRSMCVGFFGLYRGAPVDRKC